ncbi:MAG: SpoIID/LytB domain-containing protein, partial [Bacteroidota bacterium]
MPARLCVPVRVPAWFLFVLLLVGLSPAIGAVPTPAPDDLVIASEVRVRVLEKQAPRAVTVQGTEAGLTLTDALDASLIATLAPGADVEIKAEHGRIYVYLPRRVVSVRALHLAPGLGGSTTVTAGRLTRRYDGTFRIEDDRGRLQLVNTVPLEAYVASVTAGEYPFAEPEGVKAQAVLARTYALRSRGKRGAYDLVDHTSDQVYHGADRTTAVTRAAAAATQGVVLTFDGRFAETVYSSSNGGHTAA